MRGASTSHVVAATDRLCSRLERFRPGSPVTHVYNPLLYAREPWSLYCRRFGVGTKEVLFVGMNPGPFGMAQTGVPFGEIRAVRDWMGIEGRVDKPRREHPKRPVVGFACRRSEVSGARLWGWARERFGSAEEFFGRFFVYNYCPLAFMDEKGANVTPDKLGRPVRELLTRECDLALREVVRALQPRWVIGVGAYAEDRAREALTAVAAEGRRAGAATLCFGRIPHPSPANPASSKDWPGQVDRALCAFV